MWSLRGEVGFFRLGAEEIGLGAEDIGLGAEDIGLKTKFPDFFSPELANLQPGFFSPELANLQPDIFSPMSLFKFPRQIGIDREFKDI